MNNKTQHYYRQQRLHQRSIMADGGGMLTTFIDGTASQLSYGSAPYGEHAVNALQVAKSQIAFQGRMKGYA